ncbi:MAG: NAD(P)H-dependent oxidoreductase [Clostridiales bacterium]|nr:NAD(P)H-dependent oxidoreductase [Clostridiales bacterium]
MKIVAINGSPKAKGSVSELIIAQIEHILDEKIQTHQAVRLVQGYTTQETLTAILDADILLIVFPLYVDSLPASLIELLTRLEDAAHSIIASPHIFVISNCGLSEPEHTALALDMVKHFAERTGYVWGYGLGIGRGGMLASMGNNWSKGPVSNVYAALCDMTCAMCEGRSEQNKFIAPKFPRFLYIATANIGWRIQAKRNGVRKKLNSRPYEKISETAK